MSTLKTKFLLSSALTASLAALWHTPLHAQAAEPPAPEAAPPEPAPAQQAMAEPTAPPVQVAMAEPMGPPGMQPLQKDTPGEAEPPAAKPKPPPYSLPSQLRPVAPGNVVRSDTAFAFYKSPVNGESGSTVASMLLASYKVIPELAPMVRVGIVSNSPPGATAPAADPKSGFNFINPVVGATYGPNIGKSVKLGLFLGMTIPVGMGGGDSPEPGNALANAAGIAARSAMDNAMFAVNYFTVFPGVGFAFVDSGFTAQVEATVLQLFKYARSGHAG